MLTEKDQKYYKPVTLNRIFAVASILFLISLVWMFADDYERTWKRYQRKFRALESDKLSVAYDSQAYDVGLSTIETKKDEIRAEAKRKLAEQALKESNDAFYVVDQAYKFSKAEFDKLTYEYKEAQAGHGGNADDLRQKLKNKENDVKQKKGKRKQNGSNQPFSIRFQYVFNTFFSCLFS